jgi:D-amino peptidase
MTPAAACKAIRAGAQKALSSDLKECMLKVPGHFALEVTYNNPVLAYRHSWYPGAKHVGHRTIRFENSDYFEILRMLNYVT